MFSFWSFDMLDVQFFLFITPNALSYSPYTFCTRFYMFTVSHCVCVCIFVCVLFFFLAFRSFLQCFLLFIVVCYAIRCMLYVVCVCFQKLAIGCLFSRFWWSGVDLRSSRSVLLASYDTVCCFQCMQYDVYGMLYAYVFSKIGNRLSLFAFLIIRCWPSFF